MQLYISAWRDWSRDRRVAGSIPEITNFRTNIALSKLQKLWCPCSPSSIHWYQLASGLGWDIASIIARQSHSGEHLVAIRQYESWKMFWKNTWISVFLGTRILHPIMQALTALMLKTWQQRICERDTSAQAWAELEGKSLAEDGKRPIKWGED